MTNITKQHTATISKEEAEELFPLLNTGRQTYVDPKSPQFIDELIEKWFEARGYDFWNNPFPDVIEWSVNPTQGTINFTYIEQ